MANKKFKNNNITSLLKGDFILGKGIVHHLPFILMLFGLALTSISSSFHSEKLLEKSIKLEKEVEYLNRIHTAHKLDLMKMYKRSEIEKLVLQHGIKTSLTPPFIIERK
mgnify:FL=1|tara:strand:+ start:6168 stop:6494 length:327 start_codon:yes stop_codon:yes gene_type:complete